MQPTKLNCKTCKKDFVVIKQEQDFLTERGLPLPTSCPACRQARRLKDRGERTLYRTTCQQCGKNIIVSYNPETEKRKILCKECYREFFEKNSAIIES